MYRIFAPEDQSTWGQSGWCQQAPPISEEKQERGLFAHTSVTKTHSAPQETVKTPAVQTEAKQRQQRDETGPELKFVPLGPSRSRWVRLSGRALRVRAQALAFHHPVPSRPGRAVPLRPALPKACPLPSRYPATPPFRSHFLLLGDGSQRRRAFPAAVSGRRLGTT
ncbi:hypothetical protein SKAU_G00184470 [Synaphobranchus kaupii]|uniref:Uncharacterized protein n=1 Tax=Synaphobranchus kaupii TaxID=118154 RepID=A0A9Q1FC78_SYNKA|nr:hypothetical protein SKAU_G00184470 [Synaphobranchus kaupii]